jgi:hypothetical protein
MNLPPVNPRHSFPGLARLKAIGLGDKLSPMDDYIRWWESEWFKEWERLALHRN